VLQCVTKSLSKCIASEKGYRNVGQTPHTQTVLVPEFTQFANDPVKPSDIISGHMKY